MKKEEDIERDKGRESTPVQPCILLLQLPQEVRDKVHVISANALNCANRRPPYLNLRIRLKIGHSYIRESSQVRVRILYRLKGKPGCTERKHHPEIAFYRRNERE